MLHDLGDTVRDSAVEDPAMPKAAVLWYARH